MKILSVSNWQKTLIGIRISAGLLAALGCLFALYIPLFGILLVVSLARRWSGHALASEKPYFWVTSLLTWVVVCALTYLCFRAAAALRNAQRWAAYVAMAFGSLLLLFSGVFVYDIYHPERQGPDEYFGIFIVPFFFVIGMWWCIYLNLPHVRVELKGRHSS